MTRIELMRMNKKNYAELEARIATMTDGIEKDVAINMTLPWIKGKDWMGGLGNAAQTKAWDRLLAMGYTEDEIYNESDRQFGWYY